MTQAWLILTGPDGRDIAAPTEAQLAATLADLYAGHTRAADDGPGSAVLRFGYDDGLMYQLEVGAGGTVRYEEWSDRDCEIALAEPRQMSAGPDEALQLWKWLAQRQVARIREQDWLDG
ncbi:hypothetical protein E7V67_008175 [[Empedobacter] haloabium]|uniref:Dehydrogenase n=1 Tax=[Empedobacter] haloabium TaxID=592317 RepID=A0ABZ1UQT4_9BURK